MEIKDCNGDSTDISVIIYDSSVDSKCVLCFLPKYFMFL